MILTFLYATAAAAVLGLPADYTWRRARQLSPVTGLVAVAGIIAAVSLAMRVGLVQGAGAVVALIVGFVAGGALADLIASRQWGPAPDQY